MSKALDNLGRVVAWTAKTASGTVISKDKLIDILDEDLGALYNVAQFFTAIEDSSAKLQKWLVDSKNNTQLPSIVAYNKIASSLTGSAKITNDQRFLGAMSDTVNALIIILEDISGNLDKLFVDKNITIYNTKISQVAIFGMIENAKVFADFVTAFIEVLMSDRTAALGKPEKYVFNRLNGYMDQACELMNRVLNNKLSKTFTAAILKYRNSGSDNTVINSENKPTVQFTKINSDVTESDIAAGARGFKVFRWIGDWFVDRKDRKNRRRIALRDQLQARARLLQLELDGVEKDSAEYKRLVKIIENYQKQIDRLNQDIDKYENED